MKTWNKMDATEKYAQLLIFADCSIVGIEDMLDRKLAEHAVKRAYYYARVTGAVAIDEAIRSYKQRRDYISNTYHNLPELKEDGLLW